MHPPDWNAQMSKTPRDSDFPGGRCPYCHGTEGQGHAPRCGRPDEPRTPGESPSDPGYRCCGVIGGCGGPCATYPHWELTT